MQSPLNQVGQLGSAFDTLVLIMGALGTTEHDPLAVVLKETWNALSPEQRAAIATSEAVQGNVRSPLTAQFLASPCLPPVGYQLIKASNQDEVLLEGDLIWIYQDQAWIKAEPAMTGQKTHEFDSVARLASVQAVTMMDHVFESAFTARQNGLSKVNPFFRGSLYYEAFIKGWAAVDGHAQE
ncbi:hypothetical protein ACYPKM_02075 [Pseudomonas aeruginosa]